MQLQSDEQAQPRTGRPALTVTLTFAELAAILEVTPGAVAKRFERGKYLMAAKRYGLVKDVTDERSRKPAASIDADKDRASVVADLLRRLNEYRSVETPESALAAAYNAGLLAGQRGAR